MVSKIMKILYTSYHTFFSLCSHSHLHFQLQMRRSAKWSLDWRNGCPCPVTWLLKHTHTRTHSSGHRVSSIRHIQRALLYVHSTIMTENYSTLKNSLADFTFAHDDDDDVRLFLLAVFLYLFTVISTRSLFPLAPSGQVFGFGCRLSYLLYRYSALGISPNVSWLWLRLISCFVAATMTMAASKKSHKSRFSALPGLSTCFSPRENCLPMQRRDFRSRILGKALSAAAALIWLGATWEKFDHSILQTTQKIKSKPMVIAYKQ